MFGVLNFDVTREERDWPPELVTRLQLIAQIFANALARRLTDEALRESEQHLRQTLDEAQRLRDQLQMENVYLRKQLRRDDGQENIVGDSEPIGECSPKRSRWRPRIRLCS